MGTDIDSENAAPAGSTTQVGSSADSSAGLSIPPPHPQPRLTLCPYCGHESGSAQQCEKCRGLFEPLSRQASQNAMGPWFLRDETMPFRPGFSYETLRLMVTRGRVTRDSILRGPTTRQFWTRASGVPGVSHLLGVCHACRHPVSPKHATCPTCGTAFDHESDRQYLGLGAVHLLPGQASPEQVAASSFQVVAPARKPRVSDYAVVPQPLRYGGSTPGSGIERPASAQFPSTPSLSGTGNPIQPIAIRAGEPYSRSSKAPRRIRTSVVVLIVLCLVIGFAGLAFVVVYGWEDWLQAIQSGG